MCIWVCICIWTFYCFILPFMLHTMTPHGRQRVAATLNKQWHYNGKEQGESERKELYFLFLRALLSKILVVSVNCLNLAWLLYCLSINWNEFRWLLSKYCIEIRLHMPKCWHDLSVAHTPSPTTTPVSQTHTHSQHVCKRCVFEQCAVTPSSSPEATPLPFCFCMQVYLNVYVNVCVCLLELGILVQFAKNKFNRSLLSREVNQLFC